MPNPKKSKNFRSEVLVEFKEFQAKNLVFGVGSSKFLETGAQNRTYLYHLWSKFSGLRLMALAL